MLCGVAAVICDVVINMSKYFQKEAYYLFFVLFASFSRTLFSVNIIIIILVCGGILARLIHGIRRNDREAGDK